MALLLDTHMTQLLDDRGAVFDPSTREWTPSDSPVQGTAVSAADALRWLQRESGLPLRTPVAVLGTRTPSPDQSALAERLGRELAAHGVTVLCGGRGGVMEDVCRGVAAQGGISVGLLPDTEAEAANPYVTIPIATGIGVARNALIARAACCAVAIGGGYGTLSEIAFALQFGRPTFLMEGAPHVDGAATCATVQDALDRIAAVFLRLPEEAA